MPRLVHLILNNIYIYSCFSFCLFVVLLMVVYSWYSLLLMLQSMPFFHLKPGDINAIPFSRFYSFKKKHNQMLLFKNILSIILSQNLWILFGICLIMRLGNDATIPATITAAATGTTATNTQELQQLHYHQPK